MLEFPPLPRDCSPPVVLDGDLLPRLDGAPRLHPDAVAGLELEPGVTHAAVVTQGEGREYAAALDTWKGRERKLDMYVGVEKKTFVIQYCGSGINLRKMHEKKSFRFTAA